MLGREGHPFIIVALMNDAGIPCHHDVYAGLNRFEIPASIFFHMIDITAVGTGQEHEKWDDKILQGRMADYAHLPTPIDALILSLGHSNDKRALPEIIKMVDRLSKDVTLSHHRAVALALEKFSDPRASEPLARLLMKEGMSGHAMQNIEDALTDIHNNGLEVGRNPREKRTKALREIVIARALYKCGDYNGLGEEILKAR